MRSELPITQIHDVTFFSSFCPSCGSARGVGPRPEMLFFVRKFSTELARYNSRHYVKAGITGWAQVNGLRGDTSITERVQYDLYYLRHWSIAFDLQIILLTVFKGLVNKNAY